MIRKPFLLFVLCTILLFNRPVNAAEPMQRLHEAVDKVIQVLKDPSLKAPDKTEQRRQAIRKAVSEIFDFQEMAKRALARYWRKRTPEEKKEFVMLFRNLLERTYLKRIEAYRDEKILYTDERIDPPYALVKTVVVTSKGVEIPINYRLMKKNDKWMVYDVIIEGVSLVNNYRKQFSQIIRTSSYEELVKRLKQKQQG